MPGYLKLFKSGVEHCPLQAPSALLLVSQISASQWTWICGTFQKKKKYIYKHLYMNEPNG